MPVDISDGYCQTALHRAAMYNRTNVANRLLEAGANVNKQNQFNDTPLHFAAQGNSTEVGRLLLHKGADITLTNKNNETPLDQASSHFLRLELLLRTINQ